MKKSTKLIIAFFLILSGFMVHFSSEPINGNAIKIINNTGQIILTLVIGFILYNAFRKDD
jgi:hypothetical protein